jgi:hypothetical protein
LNQVPLPDLETSLAKVNECTGGMSELSGAPKSHLRNREQGNNHLVSFPYYLLETSLAKANDRAGSVGKLTASGTSNIMLHVPRCDDLGISLTSLS